MSEQSKQDTLKVIPENSKNELQEAKGYSPDEYLRQVKAYRELEFRNIPVERISTVDSLLQQLQVGEHPWVNDDPTRQYLQSAIDRVNLPKDEWAFREIESLGIKVNASDSSSELLEKLKDRQGWLDDAKTYQYVQEAIEYAKKLEASRKNNVPNEPDVSSHKETESMPKQLKYLVPELRPDDNRTIYLGPKWAEKLQVSVGDRIWIEYEDRRVWARVVAAVERDDGSIDDFDSPYIRVSQELIMGNNRDSENNWTGLGLAKGSAFVPNVVVDNEEKVLKLEDEQDENSKYININRLKKIKSGGKKIGDSQLGLDKHFQNKFGVRPGDKIKVRFGNEQHDVVVADIEEGQDWTVGSEVFNLLSLGQINDIPLRSQFDKEDKVLSFGPTIAYVPHLEQFGNVTETIKQGYPYFESMAKIAQEYGVLICMVDPEDYRLSSIDRFSGLILQGGKYRKVELPFLDAIYGHEYMLSPDIREQFKHKLIPVKLDRFTEDKFNVARVLEEFGLGDVVPETRLIDFSQPKVVEDMLAKYGEVIVKPQTGAMGIGVVKIKSEDDGGFTIDLSPFDLEYSKKHKVFSIDELMSQLSSLASYNPLIPELKESLIIQEKVKMVDYLYQDPSTGEFLRGSPEPRIFAHRGIDGEIRIGGMLMRKQYDLNKLAHVEDMTVALQKMFQGNPEVDINVVLAQLRDYSKRIYEAIEQSTSQKTSDLTIDFGIQPDGNVKLIEISTKALNREIYEEMERQGKMMDGLYYSVAGPIEYALHLATKDAH